VDSLSDGSTQPKLLALRNKRAGSRPPTRAGIPHIQLDQWPQPFLVERLAQTVLKLPKVKERESRLAVPGTKAICLSGSFASGPANAFIDDHEFCHLHAAPEGGVHLTLPGTVRGRIIDLEWAERHPLAGVGFLPDTMVMVYAPRCEQELEVVLDIIRISYQFALGQMV
jgi:hypothetical protein